MRMVPAATVSFVVQIGGGVLSALTNVYLAWALGPAQKGAAQVLVIVPAILVVVSNLGVHTAGAWFIGRRRYPLADVLSAMFWWAIIVSAAVAVPLWLFRTPIRAVVFAGIEPRLVWIALGCLPFYVLAYYVADVLLASGRLLTYGVLRLLPLVVYGVFALLLVGVRGMGLTGATVAFSSGIVASGLFALGVVLRLSRGRLAPHGDVMRHALGFGGYVHVGAVAQFLVFKIDVVIVNALGGPVAAGVYALAASIAETVWYVGRSVESVILPRIARARGTEAQQISATALRVTAGGSVLVAAGLAIAAPTLVTALLPAYGAAIRLLWLLLPAAVIAGVYIVAAGDLRGRGQPAVVAVVSVCALVANVALNLALVPMFGATGAAAVSLATYAAEAIVAAHLLSSASGVRYRSMMFVRRDDLRLFRAITHQP